MLRSMGVPWLQIVQLVPSIVDVSRELLKRTKSVPPAPPPLPGQTNDVAARVAALEENERRQAELVTQMADQLMQLTRAVTILHRRVIWLSAGMTIALLAIVATVVILRG
jgi:hypothetical protein